MAVTGALAALSFLTGIMVGLAVRTKDRNVFHLLQYCSEVKDGSGKCSDASSSALSEL